MTRSCREDGGGVPASAGELWHLGGAGRAPCGQPVWRSEESRGLCPDDYVLVIFSQMLLILAWLHPWSLLVQEEGRHPGTLQHPVEALSMALCGEGGCHLGRTLRKEAGGFLLSWDKRHHWSWAVWILSQAHADGCSSKQLKQQHGAGRSGAMGADPAGACSHVSSELSSLPVQTSTSWMSQQITLTWRLSKHWQRH